MIFSSAYVQSFIWVPSVASIIMACSFLGKYWLCTTLMKLLFWLTLETFVWLWGTLKDVISMKS